MAIYAEDTKNNADLYQQMPAQNHRTPEVVRQATYHDTLGMDKITTNRKLNEEEEVEGELRQPPETTG